MFSTSAAALIRKDFLVLRAHRRKACGEWLFPALLGILCGVVLVTAVGWLSDGNTQSWDGADDVTPPLNDPCHSYDMALVAANATTRDAAVSALRRVCPHPRTFSAERTVAAMDDARREQLAGNVVFGLPGAAETFTLEDVRAHLAEYDGVSEARLQGHMIDFLAEVAPLAEELGVRCRQLDGEAALRRDVAEI